jgi:hypothetical protein
MPWIAAGATIISSLIGSRSSRSARRQQQRAQQAQQRLAERQAALAERQAAIGEESYRNWERRFGPLAERIATEAALPVDPEYGRVRADVAQSFDAQRGANRRQNARFGINPADGAAQAEEGRMGSAEALATVMGSEQARRGAKQQRFSNMIGAYGAGSGVPSMASGFMSSAMSGMNAAGNTFGNQADAFGRDAAATAGATSGLAMDIFNGIRGSFGSGGGNAPAGASPWASGPGWTPGSTVGGTGSTWGPSWTSTRKAKEGIKPTDTAESAEIIRETPIRDWRYKNDPGTPKVGPIAEEAPPQISRDGKSVDPQNMVGTLWGGMQDLMKRLESIERFIGAPAA